MGYGVTSISGISALVQKGGTMLVVGKLQVNELV